MIRVYMLQKKYITIATNPAKTTKNKLIYVIVLKSMNEIKIFMPPNSLL